jgi:hypothetical protein
MGRRRELVDAKSAAAQLADVSAILVRAVSARAAWTA